MKVIEKKLSDLHPAERNVRLHTERQLVEYMRSLEKFKQIRPMVIDENNVILVGNGMFEAMTRLGWETASCQVVTGLSENDKKKLMLTDNKIYALGVDDMQAFDEILKELSDDDLDIPGFDDDLLRTLKANQQDIDEMLNDYGTLSAESIENIRTHEPTPAAVLLQRQETPPPPDSASHPIRPIYESETPESDHESPAGRYIICPHCGQRIEI